MHGHLDRFEQRANTFDGPAAHLSADMIRVIVGAQHTRQLHAIGLDHVKEVLHGIGRIDDERLARRTVPDEVDEVHHLARDGIALGKVSTREKLTEVHPVVG